MGKGKMQEKSVKVAVIMSLYRNDNIDYVSKAIDSILNQTYSAYDFYIQYDGPIRDEVDLYLSGLEQYCVKLTFNRL